MSSSFSRRTASASSIARASSLRSAETPAPSSRTVVSVAVSGDTTSIRPPGSTPESAGTGTGAARVDADFRCSSHAACWRFTSAMAACRSSGPISSRLGMRSVAPALSAFTFRKANASGLASRIASIMRWVLTDVSGRNRDAIDHSVSDSRTGPYAVPLGAGSETDADGGGSVSGWAAGSARRTGRSAVDPVADVRCSLYPRTARPRGQSTSMRNVSDDSMIGSAVRTWM